MAEYNRTRQREENVRPEHREDLVSEVERAELERRMMDHRDPSARRGDIETGGSISDADVGEDQIDAKGVGGYGASADVPEINTRKPNGDNGRLSEANDADEPHKHRKM